MSNIKKFTIGGIVLGGDVFFNLECLEYNSGIREFFANLYCEKWNIPSNLNISGSDVVKLVEIIKYIGLVQKQKRHNLDIYSQATQNMLYMMKTSTLPKSDHMKMLNTYYEKVFYPLIEGGLYPDISEPSLDESNFEGLFKLVQYLGGYHELTNYLSQRKMEMAKSNTNTTTTNDTIDTSTITPM
jgi:hypothetical protein